jgi:energy-coupling factor transporter ATP-binding protein EcfA2
MLASLLAPDAGTVRIGGIDPLADAAGARAITGGCPTPLGAWPSLTARETLVMTGRLYGFDRARAERAPRACSTRWGCASSPIPRPGLSRGQKQRLGLARALVHDPRVLLLDEPASGLDPQARVELRVLLRRLAAEGRTILISSHILSELEEVVDDAVFLSKGRPSRREGRRGGDAPAHVAHPARRPRCAAAAAPVAETLGLDPAAIPIDRRDLLVSFDSDASAASALAALVAAGLPVAEFAAATGLLEHTFLDLEGGRS